MKKYINRSTGDAYAYEEIKEAFEMYKEECKEDTLEEHIEAHFDVEEWRHFVVEYTDTETGATSPIDTVDAREDYTAEDYVADCEKNADPEWVEMLDCGTVELVPVED